MPDPPNDIKQRQSPKSLGHSKQAKEAQGTALPASCNNVVTFPVADEAQAKATAAPYLPEIQQVLDPLSFTPLQLLAAILKAKLRDRIQDEEVHCICQVYYNALESIWGEGKE